MVPLEVSCETLVSRLTLDAVAVAAAEGVPEGVPPMEGGRTGGSDQSAEDEATITKIASSREEPKACSIEKSAWVGRTRLIWMRGGGDAPSADFPAAAAVPARSIVFAEEACEIVGAITLSVSRSLSCQGI